MKRILVCILTLCCFSATAFAQSNDTIDVQKGPQGDIVFASFGKKAAERKISKGPDFLRKASKASTQDEFRVKKQEEDNLGMTHVTYEQYYIGIRVEGASYKLHGKTDDIESMNGKFERIAIKDSKASISESTALGLATGHIGARKYSWGDSSAEQFIKSNTNDPSATYYPKGELVIVKTRSTEKGWRVAWRFQISSIEPVRARS